MNIPASLLLIFGLTALALFAGIFIATFIVTMRNRKKIIRNFSRKP
ncbi:MAG: hypothetical protein NC117_08435 [Pseudoflavonifractor sp.]|nr:hypothetical protein [Pseudoflavonifractor sp.]